MDKTFLAEGRVLPSTQAERCRDVTSEAMSDGAYLLLLSGSWAI
jgi:hypothetical protein